VGLHRKVPRLSETVGVQSEETMTAANLRAPFPWFGGKSRAADLIWERFGDPANYVEPFAGSLAVLLARQSLPKVETVNDADCYLANFWRALRHDAETVAHFADAPVNEADLHARHLWLVHQSAFRERMKTDPEYFDTRIAGWWVWGQCLWIGSGWCDATDVPDKLPNLTSGFGSGTGLAQQVPDISRAGTGIHASGIHAYLDTLARRLRRVRVVCGDWSRVVTPAVTSGIGLTAVLLDPPYDAPRAADLYTHDECEQVSADVRSWAVLNGDNGLLRIALCGYEGEHEMPATWECVGWKARGGYGSQRKDGENLNRKRERIWFSPHCLKPGLFSGQSQ
jgi:DNA adenine methylase